MTPLTWAISVKSLEIVKYLVEHGAEIIHESRNEIDYVINQLEITEFAGDK